MNFENRIDVELDFRDDETLWIWIDNKHHVEVLKSEILAVPEDERFGWHWDALEGFTQL